MKGFFTRNKAFILVGLVGFALGDLLGEKTTEINFLNARERLERCAAIVNGLSANAGQSQSQAPQALNLDFATQHATFKLQCLNAKAIETCTLKTLKKNP